MHTLMTTNWNTSSIKKTPAEQAGINLELEQNKIENLIKLASKQM